LSSARVSPAVRPPPGNPRFPLFDSTRAIGALAIVLAHVASLAPWITTTWLGRVFNGLSVGVWIFFAVSGFLLYRPFVAARAAGRPGPRIGDFARRRVLRIVPAYWLALTVLALWPGEPYVTGPLTHDWWRYFGFLQIYGGDYRPHGLGVAWSLCVEVTFYALLPLYAIGIRRLSRALGWKLAEIGPLVAIAVLGLTVRGLCANQVLSWDWSPTLLGTMQFFTVGMGLAVASVALQGRSVRSSVGKLLLRRVEWSWALAFAAFLVANTVFDYFQAHSYPPWLQVTGNDALGMATALLVIFPAVFGATLGGLPRRILASRLLSWLGVISYGIFLWHVPLLLWLIGSGYRAGTAATPGSPLERALPGVLSDHVLVAALGSTLVLTVGAAALSYYLVELPFLRLKERRLRAFFNRRAREAEPRPVLPTPPA
jgi:peptidoglycan/LPS O-acetylase OafA/YrhL